MAQSLRPKLRLRRLELRDAHLLLAVRLIEAEDPASFEADSTREMQRAFTLKQARHEVLTEHAFGLFQGPRLVGVGCSKVINEPVADEYWRQLGYPDEVGVAFRGIYVLPAIRGIGAGRTLLARLVAHARQRRADFATLLVRDVNSAARALYESEGFRATEEQRGYTTMTKRMRMQPAIAPDGGQSIVSAEG